MDYPEALRYLDSFINYEKAYSYDYEKSLKLDRIKNLTSLLGDPHKDIKSIHIAGTKGKGSTAAIIYSILKRAGFKTALYTSPHLVSFRERIRIDDELISERDIARLLGRIKSAVNAMTGAEMPSFFEVYTAIAYLYFKESKADFAVYETGLGGRCDATNIIEPLVSVITPISYEHMDKLGDTLTKIAMEKCGIIKNGVPCVSAPQEGEALDVIKKRCEEENAGLILVGKDITFKEIVSDSAREVFDVSGLAGTYPDLESRLLGSHQVVNAAAAIGAVEALNRQEITITPEAIRSGISNARWPGRLDIIEKNPFVILDGAQNRASAKALADSVRKIFISQRLCKRLVLVLGVSKDKDIKGIVEELLPLSDSVILTKSKVVERALEPEKIRERIGEGIGGRIKGSIKDVVLNDKDVVLTDNVKDALGIARSKASRDDLILITGSLFVVGEAMELLKTAGKM